MKLTTMCVVAGLAILATRPVADPLFEEVASRVGLSFVHRSGATGQFYIPEIMGAGAALIDYDHDGDLDVFLLQNHPLDPHASANARQTHRLFRNMLVERKALGFTDVTAASGLAGTLYGMGVAAGDYDSDGDQDLYVTAFGPNTLYRNNGDGTFTDVTGPAGVGDDRWSTAATFIDYDRDGDLDLFVANYVDFAVTANKQCFDPAGALDYCGPKSYRPVPDRLFRNEGLGRFMDV
ncbi:MAG: VCBS repeat-containing protein, partial [Vicinamibacteria bacterium]|nr:VCBS repeat-containing protein [Vicinamibacteria bacterium]